MDRLGDEIWTSMGEFYANKQARHVVFELASAIKINGYSRTWQTQSGGASIYLPSSDKSVVGGGGRIYRMEKINPTSYLTVTRSYTFAILPHSG